MGKGRFWPLCRNDIPQTIANKIVTSDYIANPYIYAKFGRCMCLRTKNNHYFNTASAFCFCLEPGQYNSFQCHNAPSSWSTSNGWLRQKFSHSDDFALHSPSYTLQQIIIWKTRHLHSAIISLIKNVSTSPLTKMRPGYGWYEELFSLRRSETVNITLSYTLLFHIQPVVAKTALVIISSQSEQQNNSKITYLINA